MKKPIKVGIAGAGRIGITHAKSIVYDLPGVEIKTISDPYMSDEARKILEDLEVPKLTKNHRDIIEDSEIEAVLICSSTTTHSSISIEAAEAGKHVFCEKPIDLDIGRIKKTLAVVKKSGIKYQVGFNRRFDHNFAVMKSHIEKGRIGDVHVLKITSRDPAPPSVDYLKVSGGIYTDMMVHDFDIARFLSGSEVEEVYAAGAVCFSREIGEIGDFDTATATLKMENGAIALIDISRQAVYGYDQRAEVFGSGGSIGISNETDSSAVISDAGGVIGEKPKYFFLERYMKAYTEEKGQFFDAIRNDTEVPAGGYDGLMAVVIAEAANISARENRPVKISEIGDLSY